MSDDIIAYTRICQNMKRYLMISLHILVYVKIWNDIFTYTRIYEYIVYDGIWWYMPVYDGIYFWNKVYTVIYKYILLKQSIYRHIQCQNFDMKCLWIYITLHTCTYFDPMIRFQLHPPGWPAWKLRICCGHCSDSRHSSSSTMVFNFSRFKFYPPGPVPACQGRPQLQQGRPQRPGRPAAAATATAAVALRASGAFPP